MAYPFDIVADI